MKSVTKSKVISAVLLKDLRIELRSRVLTNQVLPFAGLVLVMFAFAHHTTRNRQTSRCQFLSTINFV